MRPRILAALSFALFTVVAFGDRQIINTGSYAGDNTGDSPRVSQIKANANFAELYNRTGSSGLSNAVAVGAQVLLHMATNSAAYRTQLKLTAPIRPQWYGAAGDGVTDDTAAFNSALTNTGDVYIPPGTYLITSALAVPSNKTVTGAGPGQTILLHTGDFRMFTATSATNVNLRGFRVTCDDGAGNQCPIRFVSSTDCAVEDVDVASPALNGIEISGCSRISVNRLRVTSPGSYGVFVYDSQDCSDLDVYVKSATGFSYELKNTKRHVSRNLRIEEPGDYGIYIWTGYDGSTTPGSKLCERNTFHNPVVIGKASSKSLIEVNASPRNSFYGAVLQHVSGGWVPFEFAGTSFYNEGSAITATATSGSTNLTSVSNGSAIAAGDRIHIGGVSGNYTVHANNGATISLTTAAASTVTGAQLGWVSSSDYGAVVGAQIACDGAQALSISGTSVDPIKGAWIEGGEFRDSTTEGLRLSNAKDATVLGLKIRDATGYGFYLDASTATASGVVVQNCSSVGFYLENTSTLSAAGCVVNISGSSGVNCASSSDIVTWTGGVLEKCKDVAALLRGGSSLIGAKVLNSRYNASGFDGQVWLYGSRNVVSGCQFTTGGSEWLDSHISEKTGATSNVLLGNSLNGTDNPIIYAGGSDSKDLTVAGALFVGSYARIPNNTWLYGRNAGGDANVAAIGIDAGNQVSIAPEGGATTIGGAIKSGSIPGITTTWTNIISGVITQRISTVNGLVVTNLTL